MNEIQEYWKKRAESYNNLYWVSDEDYIKKIMSLAKIKEYHMVLDAGTGTGIMADAIAEIADTVVALDSSNDMLRSSKWRPNKVNVEGDIEKTFFDDNYFDRIVARSVFQHIGNPHKAMRECRRILKSGGRMILAQGVPPTEEIAGEYIEIMRLKDKRSLQTEETLTALMEISGFINIKKTFHTLEYFSVRNWVENNGLSEEVQSMIFDLHLNASREFKEAYNMMVANGDCYINVKNLILVGEK